MMAFLTMIWGDCWNLDDPEQERWEEKEREAEQVEDGNASKNLFNTNVDADVVVVVVDEAAEM